MTSATSSGLLATAGRTMPALMLGLLLASPAEPQVSTEGDRIAELDAATSDAIRSACHGYGLDMLPEVLSSLRDWLDEQSPFCKDVRQADSDLAAALERHSVPYTAEDAERMARVSEAWRHSESQLFFECQSEYMCVTMRRALAANASPISQADYNRVANHCQGQPSSYGCIENWFQEHWLDGDSRALPGHAVAELAPLGFSSLMGTSPPSPTFATPAAQDAGAGAAYAPDTGFANVQAGRSRIEVDNARAELADLGDRIAARCACASSASCFSPKRYDIDGLNTAMQDADGNYEAQKRKVCDGWRDSRVDLASLQLEEIQARSEVGSSTLANLNTLDSNYVRVTKALDKKKAEIEAARRAQLAEQQRRDNAAFAGAMLTMVGGAVASEAFDIPMDADMLANLSMDVAQDLQSGGSGGQALFDGSLGLVEAATDERRSQTRAMSPAPTASLDGFLSTGSSTAAGPFRFTCRITSACVEYTFTNEDDFRRARSQCGSAFTTPCDPEPSCAHRSPNGSVSKTFNYGFQEPDVFRRNCVANHGTYRP